MPWADEDETERGILYSLGKERLLEAQGKQKLRDAYLKKTLDPLARGESPGSDQPSAFQKWRDAVGGKYNVEMFKNIQEGMEKEQTLKDSTRTEELPAPAPINLAKGGSAKVSKEKSHYRLGSNKRRCNLCTMFRPNNSCTAVRGWISPKALCDFFKRKQAFAEGGEVNSLTGLPDQDEPQQPFDEFALQRKQAEALPDRPATIMEPDLQTAQTAHMGELDPSKYVVDEHNRIVEREKYAAGSDEAVQLTPRPGVLPVTKTPEGRYELANPKFADILSNMGGGWSAPATAGAEAVLGAGFRVPRRPPANMGAADFTQGIARAIDRTYGNDIPTISNRFTELFNSGISQETLDRIFSHLPEQTRQGLIEYEANGIPKVATKPAQAKETTPPAGPLNLDTFFKHASPSEVEHLSRSDLAALDQQLRATDQPYRYHQQNRELFEALEQRLDKEIPKEVPYDDPRMEALEHSYRTEFEQEYNQPQRNFSNLDELEAAAQRQFQQVPYEQPKPLTGEGSRRMSGHPFRTVEEAKSWLKDNGHNPEDWGYKDQSDYITLANQLSGREATRVATPDVHPNKPIEFETPGAPGSGTSLLQQFASGDYFPRDVRRLSDAQVEELGSQLAWHQSVGSSFYSNLKNYQPELFDALRNRISEVRNTSRVDPEMEALLNEFGRVGTTQPLPAQRVRRTEPQVEPPAGPFQRLSQRFHDYFNSFLAPNSKIKDVDEFGKKMFGDQNTKSIIGGVYHSGQYDTPAVEFQGILKGPNGEDWGSIHRTIYPEKKFAYHNIFAATREAREQGIPAKILRSQIDLYKQMGLNKVAVSTGFESGAYAWLKYGFVPNKENWTIIRHKLTNSIANDDLHITDPIAKDMALRILENPNPRAAWDLADFKASDKHGNAIGPLAMLGHQLENPKGPASYIQQLQTHNWSGSLLLNDAAVMARFDKYVSRKPKKPK